MRMALSVTTLVAITGAFRPMQAQLTTPTHWKWVTDEPARLVTEQAVPDSAWRFVSMPPGWHVTTGPGAMMFDPAYRAEGRFSIEAKVFLFPNPSDRGYGIFVGGRDLESEGRTGLAFMARRDGFATVIRMGPGGMQPVIPWQRHEGIRAHTGSGTVENVFRVSAEPNLVVFLVNGDTVGVVPRADMPVDGYFGFRVGAGLNLHASYLDLTYHLALPPQRREP